MKPNPVRADGAPKNPAETQRTPEPRRNLFCKNYDKCLDTAVHNGWPGFSCIQCEGFTQTPTAQEEKRRAAGLEAYATQRKN